MDEDLETSDESIGTLNKGNLLQACFTLYVKSAFLILFKLEKRKLEAILEEDKSTAPGPFLGTY
jgi:hypothetical protein